jgi:hypothetical protein
VFQNLHEVVPTVSGGDGGIQFLVREVQPRGTLVVKIRARAFLQIGGALGVARFQARIADEADLDRVQRRGGRASAR